MSELTIWGLLLGLIVVGVYVCASLRKKKSPDLAVGANILLMTVGATGAVRLIGFVFTKQFATMAATSANGTWWSFSAEDGVFIVLGALALVWITCQGIWRHFKAL